MGIGLARWQPDASTGGDVIAEFAAAAHVHFENHHAQEIAVLTNFALTRHGWIFWVESDKFLILARDVEMAPPVPAAAGSAICLHLDRDGARFGGL